MLLTKLLGDSAEVFSLKIDALYTG